MILKLRVNAKGPFGYDFHVKETWQWVYSWPAYMSTTGKLRREAISDGGHYPGMANDFGGDMPRARHAALFSLTLLDAVRNRR